MADSHSRLLLSCGNFLDRKIFVWDAKTGNIVASCTSEEQLLVAVCWGRMVRDIKGRETSEYRFAMALKEKVVLAEVDVRSGHIKR